MVCDFGRFFSSTLYYMRTMTAQENQAGVAGLPSSRKKTGRRVSSYGLAMECVNAGGFSGRGATFRELMQTHADIPGISAVRANCSSRCGQGRKQREVLDKGYRGSVQGGQRATLSEKGIVLNRNLIAPFSADFALHPARLCSY